MKRVTIESQVVYAIARQLVRSRLHLQAGDKVKFILHGNSVEMIPVSGSVRDLKGMLLRPEHAISLDDMDRAIRESAG